MALIRPPRPPVSADVSAQTAYITTLETYVKVAQAAGMALQKQNAIMLDCLRWYADVDYYDLFGVAGDRTEDGGLIADRGRRARAALAAIDEKGSP